jgi:hypothetical protein
MKALQIVAGPTSGCGTKKAACIDGKQKVRQPAVRYIPRRRIYLQLVRQPGISSEGISSEGYPKKKKNKYMHIHIHTYTQVCMLVGMIVRGARANQS